MIIDDNYNIVSEYVYDAYGKCYITKNINDIANINPIRYRSYYYDKETELYYLNNRYYDPDTMRFIFMDGIEYLDYKTLGGLNLFTYCNNNPIMNIDPEGNIVISISSLIIGAIVGAVIGAGVGFATVAYNDYKEDNIWFNRDWTSYVGAILGGAISGAGLGIANVLGVGAGSALIYGYGLVVVHSSVTISSALVYAVGVAAITSAIGYTTRVTIDSKENFNVYNLIYESFIGASSGGMSFFTGALTSYFGLGYTSDFIMKNRFDAIIYKSLNYLKGFSLKKFIEFPFKLINYFLRRLQND